MYLHLGYSAVVPYGEIVGVFDLDNVSQSKRTRGFLERAQQAGKIKTVGARIPAALVVTDRGVYLSPISAQTLQKRLGENDPEG